jgi:hypothetical protein
VRSVIADSQMSMASNSMSLSYAFSSYRALGKAVGRRVASRLRRSSRTIRNQAIHRRLHTVAVVAGSSARLTPRPVEPAFALAAIARAGRSGFDRRQRILVPDLNRLDRTADVSTTLSAPKGLPPAKEEAQWNRPKNVATLGPVLMQRTLGGDRNIAR